MLDQLAKNITRCGLSNSTLNYLRVSGFRSPPVIKTANSAELDLSFCPPSLPQAMCDIGAHAGVDVQTQDLQLESQRLPKDLPLPEVAENGGTSRSGPRLSLSTRCCKKHYFVGHSDPVFIFSGLRLCCYPAVFLHT